MDRFEDKTVLSRAKSRWRVPRGLEGGGESVKPLQFGLSRDGGQFCVTRTLKEWTDVCWTGSQGRSKKFELYPVHQGQQIFFIKDQTLSIFGFMGHITSVSITHCCYCSMRAATYNILREMNVAVFQ